MTVTTRRSLNATQLLSTSPLASTGLLEPERARTGVVVTGLRQASRTGQQNAEIIVDWDSALTARVTF